MNNRSEKINIKDKWFFVFAFIPILQWIPCFMINARIKSNKNIIFGFIYILVFLSLITVPPSIIFIRMHFGWYNLWWRDIQADFLPLMWPIATFLYISFVILIFFIERPKYLLKFSSNSWNVYSNLNIPWKNKWFFCFAFLPFLQWIPCFQMRYTQKSKRYIIYGFLYLIAFLEILIIPFVVCYPNKNLSHFINHMLPALIILTIWFWTIYVAIVFFLERPKFYSSLKTTVTNYSSIKLSNKWFFCFSFFPFLQWIPCFAMNLRNKSIKNFILGFVIIIGYIGLMIYWFNVDSYLNSTRARFCNFISVFFCFWLLLLILVYFIERPKYYEDLCIKENKEAIKKVLLKNDEKYNQNNSNHTKELCPNCGSKLSTSSSFCGKCGQSITKNDKANTPIKADNTLNTTTDEIQKNSRGNSNKNKIDVNSATEKELIEILGLPVMDAKKAIDYREKNGLFTDTNGFYNSFNAKPHIVVKTEKLIVVETPANTGNKEQNNISNKSSRTNTGTRFDI